MKSKTQASLEFLIVLGLIFIIFIVMSYLSYQKYVISTDLKYDMYGRRIAHAIAGGINTLFIAGDGYSREFKFPARVYSGTNYTLSFFPQESLIYLRSGGHVWAAPLYATSIYCNLRECNNLCNSTPDEQCLFINHTMDVELTNRMESVVIGSKWELSRENKITNQKEIWKIIPFRGNATWWYDSTPGVRCLHDPLGVASTSNDIMSYLYENIDNKRLNLIFKTNGSVHIETAEYWSEDATALVEDDPGGDVKVTLSSIDLNWHKSGGEACDGAVIEFTKPGVYICFEFSPPPPGVNKWIWFNADGTKYSWDVDQDDRVCIMYP